MNSLESLRHEFADEMGDIVQEIAQDLRAWRTDPSAPEPIQEILRGLHTVKGSAGLMELRPLADLCHALEDRLAPFREQPQIGAPIDGLLDAAEAALTDMAQALDALRQSGPFDEILIKALDALRASAPRAGSPRVTRLFPRSQSLKHPLDQVDPFAQAPDREGGEGRGPFFPALDEAPGSPPPSETPSATDRDMVTTLLRLLTRDDPSEPPQVHRPPGQPAFNPLGFESRVPSSPRSSSELPTPLTPPKERPRRHAPSILVDDRSAGDRPIPSPIPSVLPGGALTPEERSPSEGPPQVLPSWPQVPVARWPSAESDLPLIGETSQGMIRVEVEKLDALLDLFGELLQERHRLARIREVVEADGPEEIAKDIAEVHRSLSLRLSELRDAVIRMRMSPIHAVFRRYPSLVEGMARSLGREVQLTIEGGDAEMDRAVIEALYQPLVHILRNAISHGIEPAPERQRRGKPRRGSVKLRAEQSGTMMAIEIRDDGRGIDPSAIATRALAQGLISPERLERMSDTERQALIFLPGMTSAETVSEVSGRGLGMDTVRSQLGRIGGRIEVESQVGEGSLFRLVVPLTLAVIQTVMLHVGDHTFGIPAAAVLSVERGSRDTLHPQRDRWLLRRPEGPVPAHSLAFLLGLAEAAPPPHRCHVAVIAVADLRFAVWADRLDGLYECVIKPISARTTALPGVLGGTSTGTGHMTLILDPAALGAHFFKGDGG